MSPRCTMMRLYVLLIAVPLTVVWWGASGWYAGTGAPWPGSTGIDVCSAGPWSGAPSPWLS
jgi:hypothetical protein